MTKRKEPASPSNYEKITKKQKLTKGALEDNILIFDGQVVLNSYNNEDSQRKLQEKLEYLKTLNNYDCLKIHGLISKSSAIKLSELLLINASIKKLEFYNLEINEEASEVLAKALENNTVLKLLKITEAHKSFASDIKFLLKGVLLNKSIEQFIFNSGTIDYEFAVLLGEVIKHNKNIKSIDLSYIKADESSWKKICEGLTCNNIITAINLMNANLSEENAKTLALALLKIEKINLSDVKTTEAGFGAIFTCFKGNTVIKEINLSQTKLTEKNLKALGEFIAKSKSIESINLNNAANNIGIKHIFNGLVINKSVREILVNSSKVDSEGALRLAEVFKSNKTLESISIGNMAITMDNLKIVLIALKTNSTIKKICFNKGVLELKDAKIFADVIKKNSTIQCIKLHNFETTKAGWIAIFEALKENKTIRHFIIDSLNITTPKNIRKSQAIINLHNAVINSLKTTLGHNENILKIESNTWKNLSNNSFIKTQLEKNNKLLKAHTEIVFADAIYKSSQEGFRNNLPEKSFEHNFLNLPFELKQEIFRYWVKDSEKANKFTELVKKMHKIKNNKQNNLPK